MNEELENHNRTLLPEKERVRQSKLTTKIHAALQEGPKTNRELSRISLDYSRAVRALRRRGIRIDNQRVVGGLTAYVIVTGQEMEWDAVVRVTLADGTESVQTFKVHGSNEALVKNRAQYMATKVKILSVARSES